VSALAVVLVAGAFVERVVLLPLVLLLVRQLVVEAPYPQSDGDDAAVNWLAAILSIPVVAGPLALPLPFVQPQIQEPQPQQREQREQYVKEQVADLVHDGDGDHSSLPQVPQQ